MPDFAGLLPALNAKFLFASLIWGSIGSGIFIYGLKQRLMVPAMAGLMLTACSYFIGSALLMSMASIFILAGVYWLKRQGYWL